MIKWLSLLSFIFLLLACGGMQPAPASSATSSDASSAVDSTALPVFLCEDYIHHLDTFSLHATPQVSTTFTFMNTGTKPLVISAAKTSCGCTSVDFPHSPILPGDSSAVFVTYNGVGMSFGFFEKTIILYTNTRLGKEYLLIDGTMVD